MKIIKNPKQSDFKIGDIVKWGDATGYSEIYYWKILIIDEYGIEGTRTHSSVKGAQKDNKPENTPSEERVKFNSSWLLEIHRLCYSSLKELIQ